jgi:CRISPR/Cas system-associated exonuclease Cas4 (RecB family)
VVFAGFNALSPAEEQLISSLRKWGLAECYWDLDEWYTERKQQEAGKFFRSLRKRWEADDPSLRGGWEWIGQALETGQKEMVVTAVPKRVGQAKAAGLLLAEMAGGVANESIALVLPDENLLFPVLHSLPATLQDVNVTMGYPLRNTPLYGLVDAVLTLHENAERLRPSGKGESVYYFRDIVAILRHPYIHQLATEESRETMRQITQENMIYLAPGYFLRFGAGHILRFLFSPWGSVSDATQYLQDLFLKLKGAFEARQKTENPLPTVESEILFQFHSLTQKLKAKLAKYLDEEELDTFRRIYREVIAGASLPFAGEPLKGIQVMGMLETRVLDFERLIILSANEGILPPRQSQNSMVPYGIRKAFGMPTYEDKDAVYAYHFYRLLQRASQVRILYDAVSDGLGGGERSRFIAQIEVELMARNPGLRLRHETFTFPSEPEAARPVIVWKDASVLRKLVGLGQENGFSPSSLNSYLQCSLQFYFRQVLGLREQTLPEETMEDNTFGSVVHKIMERLYLPHVGQTLQPEDIRRLMEGIDATSEMVFAEKTHGQDHRTGHNRLLLGVVKDLVRQMLELDRMDAPIELIGLEQRLEALVPTTGHPGGLKIAGVVDRIDCVGGKTRIIDYKTGRVDSLAVRNFLELKDGAPKKEVFQLGSYAYLYYANHSPERPVYPGIFAMRNLSDGIKTLEYGPQKAPDFDLMSFSEFQGLLTNILDDILDPGLPFVQTNDVGRCLFCPYKVICNRG